jgi:hypothetical protein
MCLEVAQFPLGDFIRFDPDQAQLMIDALQDLIDFVAVFRDAADPQNLTSAEANDALAKAFTMANSALAAPKRQD